MKKSTKHLTATLCVAALLAATSFGGGFANAASPLPQKSTTGMVMSTNQTANAIGTDILNQGGNAFDAAVAVGYALAVVHPAAGNIGGGGFAILHSANGKSVALDFREVAPAKATRDMYLDANKNPIPNASTVGYLAAGVPGTVAGMSAINEKYGSMPLNKLIEPAINLANTGIHLTERQGQTWAEAVPDFNMFKSSQKYFLKTDGTPYKEGDLFVQKDLAKTLDMIAKEGSSAFYKGKIADMIANDMAKNKGIITKQDLANYQVVWRAPIEGTYRGYDIISMSPPSSGGTHLLEILNVMENANIHDMGFGSSQTIHLMAEAERQAYADRSEYMGDPAFVKVPVTQLTDKTYAKKIFDAIKPDKATPSTDVKPGLGPINEGNNTTHYSVVDKWGNAVSVTYTINDLFGSRAAVDGAGFLLNNEMDDFSIKAGVPNLYGLVGSDANAIAPGKRPLSSMTPTMVMKNGKLFMVVGSPGGARIITTVLQVVSNVIDHDMNISQAVEAPRFHMQWLPDQIRIEQYGMSKDVQDALEKMGYKIVILPLMGDVNAIVVDPTTGVIYGSGDPRTEF